MINNIEELSLVELLKLHGAILVELRRRKVCRSENNPTGDYAEYLATQKLGLALNENSTLGFDAVDTTGLRYQIKGRRLTPKNRSTQMGAIRNLNKEEFDFLIGILFDEDYSVLKAVKIPHATIKDHARYRSHQNAHILHLNPKLLANSQVEDLAGKFADATSILVQT